MVENPDCPCCDGTAWRNVGNRTFRPRNGGERKGWRDTALDILFNVWVPGASEFTVAYKVCTNCGFMLYAPRPTQEEVTAKYQHSTSVGHHSKISSDAPREAQRAERIFKFVAAELPKRLTGMRILDFGGGDGRLLRSFVHAGAVCHTLDYVDRTIPGVTRLGSTEHDLDRASEKYDAIICNHVVEHLVSPLSLLSKLQTALKPGGVIYVEVPVEIWRGPPTPWEPVTHINFFVPGSLADLMRRAGFAVKYARLAGYPHPLGYKDLVVRCIACPNDGRIEAPNGSGVKDVEKLISPDLALRLKRKAMLMDLPGALMRRVQKPLAALRHAR